MPEHQPLPDDANRPAPADAPTRGETNPEVSTEHAAPAGPAAPESAAPAATRPADVEAVITEPAANGLVAAEPAPSVTPVEPTLLAAESATESAPVAAAPAIAELPPAECAARLAELFPAVFTPGAAKPLKLRIQADIQQRAPGIFTKKSLSIFLHRHTTGTAYLKALVGSPQRVDLDGQPAGDVADEHRAAATEELDRRRGLHAVRRAAERDAQRKLIEAQRKAGGQGRSGPAPDTAPQGLQPGAIDAAGGDAVRPPGGDRPPRHAQLRGAPGGPQRQAAGRRDGQGRGQGGEQNGRPQDRPRGGPAHARVQGARQRPASEPAHGPARGAHRVQPPADGHTHGWSTPTPPPAAPDDPARRERWLLLRAYETTTLTKANFCALKRMSEGQLDELLAQARQDEPARQEPARRDGSARRPPAPHGAAPGVTPLSETPPQRKAPRR